VRTWDVSHSAVESAGLPLLAPSRSACQHVSLLDGTHSTFNNHDQSSVECVASSPTRRVVLALPCRLAAAVVSFGDKVLGAWCFCASFWKSSFKAQWLHQSIEGCTSRDLCRPVGVMIQGSLLSASRIRQRYVTLAQNFSLNVRTLSAAETIRMLACLNTSRGNNNALLAMSTPEG
jgi:hypothetical protein